MPGYYPGMMLRGTSSAGFTLMELMVAIAIIALLAGLLIPAIGLVRERSRRVEAAMVVTQLAISLETYGNEDRRHRFPLEEQLYPTAVLPIPHPIALQAQGGATAGVLALLLEVDTVNLGNRSLDADGCMLDPWRRRYNFQLTRPAPSGPAGALQDWNWDAALARPGRWNDRADAPAPFPYVWSTGKDGRGDVATAWIYDPRS